MTKFEEFWAAYPNKKGKGAAQKRYEKIDAETHKQIMLAIGAQQRYRTAAAKTGEWLPQWCMPSTWLTQSRWLDEIPSHSALREKADTKICCIDDCHSQTMGNRFPVCEHHHQFTKGGRLRGCLGLVDDLRNRYASKPEIQGLRGREALTYIKRKIGEIGR